MKKNFFKKLASVLSLALVVTSVAPLAGTPASAAAAPNLKARYSTVYEGQGRTYAVKNVKGYTVKWTVSGAGAKYAKLSKKSGTTTKLTVSTKGAKAAKNAPVVVKANFYKKNKKVRSSGDTVNIKIAATAVAMTTAADIKAVPVGEAIDFNRTITPANATSFTYWSVTDKDGAATTDATIDAKGGFTATKVGDYVVTATVKNAKNGKVITTASETVTAVFKVKSAKMVATNKVEIAINTKIDNLAAKDVTIVNTESKLKQPVKAISVSADGLTVTAEAYSSFTDGKTYTVTINNSSADFTAKIGKIASITVPDQLVEAGVASEIKYSVLDENGLDITSEYPLTKTGVQVTLSKGSLDSNKKITLVDKDSAFVTIKFNQYDNTGKDISVTSNQAKITGAKAVVAAVNSWTIADSGKVEKDLDFTKPVQEIAAKTTGKHIYIKYKNNVNADKVSTATKNDGITFTSLNTDVLIVDATTGLLYAQKAGSADVKVEAGGNTIIYLTVVVKEESKLTSLVVEPTTVALSTALTPADSKQVTVKLKDQYSNDKTVTTKNVKIKTITGDSGIVSIDGVAVTTNDMTLANVTDKELKFTLTQVKKGTCTLLIDVDGVTAVIPVTVAEVAAVAGYTISTDRTTADPQEKEDVNFSVYAVDASGTKAYVATSGTYTLKDSTGKIVKDAADKEIKDIALLASNKITTSTSSWQLADGVYTIEAKLGTYLTNTTFTVKTTRPVPALTVNSTSVEVSTGTATVLDALKKSVTVKVDGNDVTSSISGVKFISTDATVVATSDSVFTTGTFIKTTVDTKVTVRVQSFQVAVNGITYTVDVNQDLTITVK